MANAHWSQAYFKQAIISVSPLNEGRQNQIDLITLADKSKWVCKILPAQTWLGVIDKVNLELTEKLAAKVAAELGLTFAAYQGDGNTPILTINDEDRAIIVPYCEGQVLTRFSEHQAFLLGGRLAQLHSIDFFRTSTAIRGAKPFPAIRMPKKGNYPPWLAELIAICNSHRQYEADKWLFSHRDIHAANIIWPDAENPHLIDWESAGLIHPAIELVGLATNCADLALCRFLPKQFKATLLGYGQYAGKLPKIDSRLWDLSLHSWLLWFAYCLRQGRHKEAEQTLQIIVLINDKRLEMQQLYATLFSYFSD